ncbi:hypothetical protein EWM64_g2411 [Hericium alpestre]|uniref:Calcipressin n=1 Tax=Hericium alpestre TaxID=135208 RepID=A0A4Z0A5U0_9AGAM|nr:hypothetical protein EWM64_g2411 [Hericium alpestre]
MPGVTIDAGAEQRSASPQRTNTLVITSIPAPFFHPLVMQALREHFEHFGPIHTWAPIRAFARVILVYYNEDAAEEAKIRCDGLVVDATIETAEFVLRVFRGEPTPIDQQPPKDGPDPHYLRPPAIEKNFLISPPGSPPVGWEPMKEEPPNVTPLADDLIAALRKLHLVEARSGPQVLVEPEEGAGIGVYVEDCDAEDDEEGEGAGEWGYGEDNPSRMKWRPAPTALPPVSWAAV